MKSTVCKLIFISQDFWLSENALTNWPAALDALSELRGSLKCLYLAGNPATSDMAAVQVSCQASIVWHCDPGHLEHCQALLWRLHPPEPQHSHPG